MKVVNTESEISKNYAKALFEVAGEKGITDEILQQFGEVVKTVEISDDIKIVLSNSSVSSMKKNEITESVFGGKIHQELLNFLKVLTDKGRFSELGAIYSSFVKMVNLQKNKKVVEIISPIELSFENKSNVLFKLEHKLKSEITPIWEVDKSLIAGLVFKFDDYVIDTSVRAKLKNLGKTLNR